MAKSSKENFAKHYDAIEQCTIFLNKRNINFPEFKIVQTAIEYK